jgi:PEGA domain-containing protein
VGSDNLNPLDELRSLDRQIDRVNELAGLKPIFFRLEEIAKECANDFEIQLAVGDSKQRLVNRGTELKKSNTEVSSSTLTAPPALPPTVKINPGEPFPAPPPPRPAPPPDEVPTVQPPPPSSAVLPMAQPPVTPTPPKLPVPPLAPAPLASRPDEPSNGALPWKRALMIGAAVGAVLAVVVIIIVVGLARRRARQQIASSEIALAIATVPPGATVRINGDTRCTSNCNLSLPAGNYQVTAFLEGYEVAASGVELVAGKPASISLTLEPQPPSLRIVTDLDQGKVALDDQPPADLQEGQYSAERLQPGPHTLKLTGRNGGASFSFEVAPAALPMVTAPLTVRNLNAILLTSFGSQARVLTNTGPLKLAVNGQSEADAGPNGVDLKNFKPGVNELVVGDGADKRSKMDSFPPSPTLTLFLDSDVNIGTLIVSTGGEDDVKVFLNNREQRRTTARGQLRIQAIGPQTVRVAKEGYDVAPPQQTAEVKKGAETRLEFKLTRIPVVAALVISGATPGADIYIDNNKIGTTGPEGGFVGPSINPGDHDIELRLNGFGPKRFRRSFRAGQTVTVSGAEVTLEAVRLPPPPPAPPQTDKQKDVVKDKAPPPAPKEGTMADFEDPSLWRQEGGAYLHRGQGFLAYKLPAKGIFTFTVQLLKGGNFFRGGKVRWCVNRVDDKNYDLFEIDSKSLSSRVMQDGKLYERPKVAIKDLGNQKQFAIQIDVSPEHIVHKIFMGGEWMTLDSWAEPGRNFSQGKFGFLVQGNDEIGLTEFKFQPK